MQTIDPARRLKPILALACALACAGVTCAHAHAREDAPPRAYRVQMQLAVHGQASAPLMTVEENQPFAVAGGGDGNSGGKPWRAEFVLHRVPDASTNGGKATVRLTATILDDGKVLAKPTLIGALGERMAVQVGDDVKLALVVKDLAP